LRAPSVIVVEVLLGNILVALVDHSPGYLEYMMYWANFWIDLCYVLFQCLMVFSDNDYVLTLFGVHHIVLSRRISEKYSSR
jgi:hypothetical protein